MGYIYKMGRKGWLILAYRNNSFFHVIPIFQFPEKDREEIRNFLSCYSVKEN